MSINWKPEITVKDVVQLSLLIISMAVMLTTMRAAIETNSRTLVRLEGIANSHEHAIRVLLEDKAAREAYARGVADGKKDN